MATADHGVGLRTDAGREEDHLVEVRERRQVGEGPGLVRRRHDHLLSRGERHRAVVYPDDDERNASRRSFARESRKAHGATIIGRLPLRSPRGK